jgi:hypothetical protein
VVPAAGEHERQRPGAAGEQERQDPVSGGAWPHYQRYPRRPACTGCGAEFTDERWRAVERVGWGTTQEPRPALCGDCDREAEVGLEQAWPGVRWHQEQQGQAVPEPKAGGWFFRFRW